MARKTLQFACFCMLLLGALAATGQTFEINPQNNSSTSGKKEGNASAPSKESQSSTGSIGWGSGIEVARDARAAQRALEQGNYTAAVSFATRAANSAPQDTALWFTLGYAARLAGQYQVSIDAYQRGLQNSPSSISGLSGLAQTYARMGRQADAQELLTKVLAANPKSVTDLELAGELALNSDPGTALNLLQRSEALKPNARSELLIARVYQRLNQPEQSKQLLQRAENRAPKDPNVLRAVAAFYRDSKQYDIAIAKLQKVADTKDPQVLPELAYTYQLAGRRKEAAETYTQAANRQTGDANLQLSAAQALANIGQFDSAETFLKRAAAQDANNYRLHAIRGQMDNAQNMTDEAIREYRLAIDHMPPGVPEGPLYPIQLHLSLAELYRSTDNSQAADKDLALARTQINQIQPGEPSNQPEYLRLRALVEAASDDFASAERDLKTALTIEPQNVTVMLNYANLLWKMNRKQDAYDLYTRAITVDPVDSAGLTALGYLAREIKDTKTAEKYFTKLVTLYPKDYVPYLALGDLYTSDRDFPQAQANYEKAHQLAPNNPLVVAGGINAALEAHQLPLAKNWIDRAAKNSALNQNPQVMREYERYLTFTGDYAASAELGYKVIEKLPRDPEAPVYLAYDLLFLNRYQEALSSYDRALELEPQRAAFWSNKAAALCDAGAFDEALACADSALSLEPQNASAWANKAVAELAQGRRTEAGESLERARKLAGPDLLPFVELTMARLTRG